MNMRYIRMLSCTPSDPEAAHSNALRLRGGTGHLLAAKTHFWPRWHLPRYDSCTVQISRVVCPIMGQDLTQYRVILTKYLGSYVPLWVRRLTQFWVRFIANLGCVLVFLESRTNHILGHTSETMLGLSQE